MTGPRTPDSPVAELREVVRLLRERAARVPTPWGLIEGTIYPLDQDTWAISNSGVTEWAQYLFSMHPGVAAALADWLEAEADRAATGVWALHALSPGPLRFARTYLGTDAG